MPALSKNASQFSRTSLSKNRFLKSDSKKSDSIGADDAAGMMMDNFFAASGPYKVSPMENKNQK